MKEFKGRLYKGERWYYESTYNGEQYCHDPSRNVLPEIYDTPSWGHEGIGTTRLAAVMIQMALTPDGVMGKHYPEGYEDREGRWHDDDEAPPLVISNLGWPNGYSNFSEKHMLHQLRITRRHMHAFAKDVLANLPDNWEMSRKEILDWIEKQEQKDQNEQTKPAS